jgi:nucleotide-binding universal stress UspA family protein
MKTLFSNPDRPVCVAVAFDDNAAQLIKSAQSLAVHTGSKLLLVHVTEPWVGAAGMGIMPIPEISDQIQEELIGKAKRQLQELAMQVKGVETIVDVRLGVVADEVIASAQHYRAKVIFTGRVSKEPSFIPLGFSSALGIMGNAPVPVIVLSDSTPIDFSKSNLKVLVADDMSKSGEAVLAGGYALAACVDGTLEHVHANGITKEGLEAALTLATAASKGTPDSAISGDDYMVALRETITKRMHKRLQLVEEEWHIKAGIRVQQKLVDGSPDDAVAVAAQQFKPDIIAFGRHHTFYRKPFLIGKVPFKAMLKMSSAGLLIVPPDYGN